jgi:TolB-like protein/Tfp pilus assembly protein PilF
MGAITMPDEASISKIIRFDKYEVDVSAGHLFRRGVKVKLRDQSFRILAMLLERPGEVITREQLRHRLWSDDTFVDFDNILNTAVARLREALKDSAGHPRFIETLPKRGYRFIGSLSESVRVSEQMPKPRTRLAILPFANLGGETSQDYLCEGIMEEIITELASLIPERLAVIARTTAMHYRDSHKDVARIGRELGVDYVVEGSVRHAANRLLVNVQLIQVSDQTHLWAKRYEGSPHDILTTVAAATNAIAAQIGILEDTHKPAQDIDTLKSTEDVAAYNVYLQGRYYLNKWTPEGILTAKQCFEDAIKRDPEFALAHCSLAETYWYIGFFGFVLPKEAFSMGVWSALRAIEINSALAEAHAILGAFRKELDYNWPEVQREMSRALELNPYSPSCRFWNGVSGLMPLGRIEEAIAELECALEMDPLSSFMHGWLAELLNLGRQYERGMLVVKQAIEREPNHWLIHLAAGQFYRDMQLFDQAKAALRRATELAGESPFMLGWLGQALVNSGDMNEARAILKRLHLMESQAYVLPTSFAWIHLALEEIDSAINWMDKAIDNRDSSIIPIKTYPFLDPLRDDPRFVALLRKMNLEP